MRFHCGGAPAPPAAAVVDVTVDTSGDASQPADFADSVKAEGTAGDGESSSRESPWFGRGAGGDVSQDAAECPLACASAIPDGDMVVGVTVSSGARLDRLELSSCTRRP